ncbi:MAG TPA: sialidase family protein [Candidatus Aquilonibacter sp.]|nr:sialidase family protein [Candidatus Aquilonibacter sp.]
MPTIAPSNLWNCVALSADGSKLVAVSESGPDSLGSIYTSPDGGTTWVSNNVVNTNWSSCASSADGTMLVAVANGGAIYTSTNSGAIWTQSTNAPALYWNCVASSADGTKLAAVDGPGGLWPMYLSTNSGATWTNAKVASEQAWNPVTLSADGTRLASGTQLGTGPINFSTNSGASWFTNGSPANNSWRTFASSADGTTLICAAGYTMADGVYFSTDAGATWGHTNVPGPNSVAASADGKTLLIGVTPGLGSGGPIYISTNSGATWAKTDAPITNSWQSVACSADGNKLVAVARGGGIWTAQMTPSPQINFSPPNGNVALSWFVPSTNFILQSSPDLFTWMAVTNQVALNLTDLQDEVSLPVSASNSFFRLSTSP